MLTHPHDTIIGDIPGDWESKPLRSLLSEQSSGDWGADEGEEPITVIRSTNFTNSGVLDFSDVATRYFPADKAGTLALSKGDVLVERSGGGPDQPVGRIAFVPNDMARTTVSNFVQILRPDPEKVDPEFFGWVLYELQRTGMTERVQQQSTQMRNLQWRDYQRLLLPWPEISEQRRIAAVLRSADDAIRNAAIQLDALLESKRSMVSELFSIGTARSQRSLKQSKIGLFPEDWEVRELRSLWSSATNGMYVPESQYGSGVPIVRIDSFNDGFFLTRDFKRIRIDPAGHEAYSVEAGDVLLNRVNSIPFLGKVVFVDSISEFTVFESNMMRLRFETTEIARYVTSFLSAPSTKRRIWSMGRPAVAQLSINQRDVGKFLIAFPRKSEREAIVAATDLSKHAMEQAEQKIAKLEDLKKSLLQNLMVGRVRIPEGLI